MLRKLKSTIALLGVAFLISSGPAIAVPVGYWNFEEGAADAQVTGTGSVLDQTGNGHHGSPTGNPFYRSDVPANPVPLTGAANTRSLAFDGNGDYVTIAQAGALGPTSAFTVEFWMKAASSTGTIQRLVVDKSHGFPDETGWAFQILFGGRMAFNIGDDTATYFPGIFSTASVLDDEWHHIAGTYDIAATGQELKLYIDGMLDGTLATGTYISNTRDVVIGAACTFPGCAFGVQRYFDGKFDELRISDSALVPNQLLNATMSVPEPGTLALFGIAILGLGVTRSRGII